jgi:hypothetical protein
MRITVYCTVLCVGYNFLLLYYTTIQLRLRTVHTTYTDSTIPGTACMIQCCTTRGVYLVALLSEVLNLFLCTEHIDPVLSLDPKSAPTSINDHGDDDAEEVEDKEVQDERILERTDYAIYQVIESEKKLMSANLPSGIDLKNENLPFDDLEETITSGHKQNSVEEFLSVVNSTNRQLLFSKCDHIVKAMNSMDLGMRERGSNDGACRFKTLLGRYFWNVKSEPTDKNKPLEPNIIERGRIVSINGYAERRFLVYGVWTAYGNKWFLTKPGKDPVWRNGIVDKKYRIGLREVKVDNDNTVRYIRILGYMPPQEEGQASEGEAGEEEENHFDGYKFVTLASISQLHGKVDI